MTLLDRMLKMPTCWHEVVRPDNWHEALKLEKQGIIRLEFVSQRYQAFLKEQEDKDEKILP